MAVDADAAGADSGTTAAESAAAGELIAAEDDNVADEDGELPVTADTTPQQGNWRLAVIAGLVIATTLGALVGWIGFRVHDSRTAAQQRAVFAAAARQGALNLTTISYTEVDQDIERILDSATGVFHDDFQQRSAPFIDAVRQAKSTSQGTVTDVGLESVSGDSADALVSVAVTTSTPGAEEQQQQPRAWRMRITVQKDGDSAKVSNVEFVP
jgi:Mce-associated membrane protein